MPPLPQIKAKVKDKAMSVKLPLSGVSVDTNLDVAAIRQRYADERDGRANRDALAQFQGLSDVREIDSADPYSTPISREPVAETVEAVVLGGGFGGLLSGAYLAKNGVTDIRIIEQGGDFGGTWYWNRYPGIQCDVESYEYLPLLEKTGYVPTRRYASGAEIFEHSRRIGRHFDLYPAALFQTAVTAVTWLDDEDLWEVRTDRDDVIRAKFVLRANGPLSKPILPRLAGIADFEGKIFHASRWDYEYTGGDANGNLENLRDKRVAIIGTGATALQAIPHLANDAKELFVIQRTPSVVVAREDRPTDPEWAAALQPGWAGERQRNLLGFMNGPIPEEDLIDDMWTRVFAALPGQHLIDVPVASLPPEDQFALNEIADMELMQAYHRRVESIVDDPETAEALKPWFGYMCKRPCANDGYLPAFNLPSVHLVHAPTGVERITADAVVVDGRQIEVDCVIFATGFETGSTPTDRYGYDIAGRNGLSLRDYFSDGLKTLHGFHTRGFPNFLEIGASQNAYALNFSFMLDRKAHHAARIVARALRTGIEVLEAEQEAQDNWVKLTHETAAPREFYLAACTPGYYNGQGDNQHGFWREFHNVSEFVFWKDLDDWFEAETYEGMSVKTSDVLSTR